MQNIWVVGLILSGLVGTGAIIGMGAMSDLDSMHHMMHGDHHNDCSEHDECEYEVDDCPGQLDNEWDEEQEYCDEHAHMDDNDDEHGCLG